MVIFAHCDGHRCSLKEMCKVCPFIFRSWSKQILSYCLLRSQPRGADKITLLSWLCMMESCHSMMSLSLNWVVNVAVESWIQDGWFRTITIATFLHQSDLGLGPDILNSTMISWKKYGTDVAGWITSYSLPPPCRLNLIFSLALHKS